MAGRRDAIPKADIGAVLRHYGAVLPAPRSSGGWQRCRCPFHDDRHASASVSYSTGYFRCFSCDISDDALGIVMEREGLEFNRARVFLDEELRAGGVEVPSTRRTRRRLSGGEGDNGGSSLF